MLKDKKKKGEREKVDRGSKRVLLCWHMKSALFGVFHLWPYFMHMNLACYRRKAMRRHGISKGVRFINSQAFADIQMCRLSPSIM